MIDCPFDALEASLDPVEREAAALGRSERRLAVTQALAEIGLDLARALRAEVMAKVSGVENAEGEAVLGASVFGGDVGLAYSRIARAVRMTLALEAMIDGDVQAVAERLRAGRRARETAAAEEEAQQLWDRGMAQVRRSVRRAIEADSGERAERERLYGELDEVLEDEHDWEMMAGRPMAEAIAYVCRELGVPYDPVLWVDDEDETAVAEVPDRDDPPDGLDRALERGGERAWPADLGKPRPP